MTWSWVAEGGGSSSTPAPPTLLGNQTLSVSTAAVSLTVPVGATYALLTVEGGDVRYWENGTAPTSTAGLLAVNGNAVVLEGNLSTHKFILASGSAGPASLNISYRKYT